MADTIIGHEPNGICADCGRKGTNVTHWGPLVPAGSNPAPDFCTRCWRERDGLYRQNSEVLPLGRHLGAGRRVLEAKATEILRCFRNMDQLPVLLDQLLRDTQARAVLDLMAKAHVYEFPKADNTTDAVVFGLDLGEGTLNVLLIERGREGEPFHGCWALPGGFLNMDEDLDTCVRRELEEETGIRLSYLEQLYTFGRPGRDPRGRVISTAYLALVRSENVTIQAADDAARARWFSIYELPSLAFDHEEIIQKALERLRSKVLWQPVGIDLLPEEFTLTDLQQVYEIVLGRLLDKRNFRKKILSHGVLVETGSTRQEAHRPAKMYRFDRARYQALVQTGFTWEV